VTPPTVTCRVKTSLAPVDSTVYLQIYNRISTLWETLDSDSVSLVNTKFTLTGTLTGGLSQYKDINNWYAFRVYQLIQ